MDANELHELMMILKDAVVAGRFKTYDADLAESLRQIRYGADGRVDPSTVNAKVRAAAMSVVAAQRLDQMERIPLHKVQELYFEGLESYFGDAWKLMREQNLTPQQVGEFASSKRRFVEHWESHRDEITEKITHFWRMYADVVDFHLARQKTLKAVFGGDMFPSYTNNIACSVGLYLDTVVLPDPVLFSVGTLRGLPPDKQLQYVVKHALNAFSYRELALADTKNPIVVLRASMRDTSPEYMDYLKDVTQSDVLAHLGTILGREFDSVDQAKVHLKTIVTPDDLASRLAAPERLVFDAEWSGTSKENIERYLADSMSLGLSGYPPVSAGVLLYMHVLGRMMQANDAILESSFVGGTPLIDAPTSWRHLLWKMEYDVARGARAGTDHRQMLISRAIQVAGSGRLNLLRNITPDALIALRQNGALDEMRAILAEGIDKIDTVDDVSVREAADAMIRNLEVALDQHAKDVERVRKSGVFFGIGVAGAAVATGISIAAAATGSIPLGLLGVGASTIGAPTIKELLMKGKELRKDRDHLRRSPVAICVQEMGKFGNS